MIRRPPRSTLSLHDALPISDSRGFHCREDIECYRHLHRCRHALIQCLAAAVQDRKSTRLNSSHVRISYAVFCLKKKKKTNHKTVPSRLSHVNSSHNVIWATL